MKKSKILITGAAGFIGSHFVDKLFENRNTVIAVDNFSSGREELIKKYFGKNNFEFHKRDIINEDISELLKDVDFVFHFAANPDVKTGAENTNIQIEQNIVATYKVLDIMRQNKIKNIVFASTSTVYGNAEKIPTPENYSPLIPISLYGASKLASEALISSYCHTFDMKAWIFRFANVIGERSTHGVIFDFIRKLENNPNELEIFGNGEQNKSYIYIDDCVNAVLTALENSDEKVNVFNVGSEDQTKVKKLARIVSEEMKLKPKFRFTGGVQGWRGDVPVMMLDVSKLKSLGWRLRYNSDAAIRVTVKKILSKRAKLLRFYT